MTTRRIVASERTILDKDDRTEKSNIAPAVPANVIYKLLGFTFLMVTVPIGTYFLTASTIFKGNSTFSGALAAIMANVVLVAYIVVAYNEDQSDRLEAEKNEKKGQ